MSVIERADRTTRFFAPAMKAYTKQKFNYSFDSMADIPGPCLILANHNTDWDPILLAEAYGRGIRFVATEHILRNRTSALLLTHFFNPIVHTKGKVGAKSTIEILRTLKGGDSVCIFAEGNRSFHGVTGEIPDVTGKLAKKSGVTLVTFRFEGGYFTQPRWGKSFRKGSLVGRLAGVYSPEQLKGMTDDEVQAVICRDLHEDAYERQKENRVAYRGSRPAEGLETALYRCPACGSFEHLRSSGNELFCSCGWRVRYDEYGMLHTEDGREYTITELAALQRDGLRDAVDGGDRLIFSDTVRIGEVISHRVETTRAARLTAYPDRFLLGGKSISPKEIIGAAIFSRNTLLIHHDGEDGVKQYEIKGSESFSALKYLDLYHLMQEEKKSE